MAKTFKVTCTNHRDVRIYEQVGTLESLVKAYSYTLECGASYSHEKGNSKINCNPKNIAGLVSNLNKAVNNSAANGYAGKDYTFVEVIMLPGGELVDMVTLRTEMANAV